MIKSASSRSSLAMPSVPAVGPGERSPRVPPNAPVGILRKRVTVLDDSFLLGNGAELAFGSELEAEVDEQRSDSGINGEGGCLRNQTFGSGSHGSERYRKKNDLLTHRT